MERFRYRANTLQGALQYAGQLAQAGRARQGEMLKRSVMRPRQNPCLIRDTGCIRAGDQKISSELYNPHPLLHLLCHHVTKHAPFLLCKVIETCAQLIERTTGNEGRSRQFRVWVLELLSRPQAKIFIDADITQPGISLEVLNALRN